MARNSWSISPMRTSVVQGALASILLISPALAQQPAPDPSPIPPPSQPAPASPNAPTAPLSPAAPSTGASPSSHMMRTWRRLTYSCNGGAKVIVNLHGTSAHVVFQGHTYNMKQVDESAGQKYTDGAFVWRNKDEVGSLKHSSKSGDNKSLAAGCHLQSAGTNPAAAPTTTPPSQP